MINIATIEQIDSSIDVVELSCLMIRTCEGLLRRSVDLTALNDAMLGEFFEDAGNFLIGVSEQISENRLKSASGQASASQTRVEPGNQKIAS